MNIRGKYRWMVSRKDLRLFNPGMSATFTVPRATTLWNHRICKPASVGGLFHLVGHPVSFDAHAVANECTSYGYDKLRIDAEGTTTHRHTDSADKESDQRTGYQYD